MATVRSSERGRSPPLPGTLCSGPGPALRFPFGTGLATLGSATPAGPRGPAQGQGSCVPPLPFAGKPKGCRLPSRVGALRAIPVPSPPVLCPRRRLRGLLPWLRDTGRPRAGQAEAGGRFHRRLWSLCREQARLRARVVEEDTEGWQKDPGFAGLERVGGVDLSYVKGEESRACASLVVLSFPALQVLYEDCRMVAVGAPYLAGFLAFREVPFLVEALQRLQQEQPSLKPQVLLVDGNGLLHPRGFGVACHLGVLTDLPCIGVAKNLLHVDGLAKDELHKEQIRSLQREGDSFPLTGTSGRVLGMALRSHHRSFRPLYVSVGHRVCLGTAVRLVQSCCRYRIPEPIRQADMRSREYIRKQLCSPLGVLSAGPERKKEEELDD